MRSLRRASSTGEDATVTWASSIPVQITLSSGLQRLVFVPRDGWRRPELSGGTPPVVANRRQRHCARTIERRRDLARKIGFVLCLRLHADRGPCAVRAAGPAKVALGFKDAIRVTDARLVVVGSLDGAAGIAVRATFAPLERPRATCSVATVARNECAHQSRGPRDVFAGEPRRAARCADVGRRLGASSGRPHGRPFQHRPVGRTLRLPLLVGTDEPVDRASCRKPAWADVCPARRAARIVRCGSRRRIGCVGPCASIGTATFSTSSGTLMTARTADEGPQERDHAGWTKANQHSRRFGFHHGTILLHWSRRVYRRVFCGAAAAVALARHRAAPYPEAKG
jgi:hypothetical protein